MVKYRIITDSCCDLPKEEIAKLNIDVVQLGLNFRDQLIKDPSDQQVKEMYDALRKGECATTTAANPQEWADVIGPVLASGQDALVMVFSSGLSTTYQSACIAAQELKETYPDRTVLVLDTRAASLGQGLYVWYACKKRDEGLSLQENYDWCMAHRENMAHWFTVDDLMFLKRGGRVSAATALLGTMLNIKPILHVDNEGHLISVSKTRGRKSALDQLVKKLETDGLPGENETVFISHGDCLEDAQYVADQVKAKLGVKNVLISYVGAVIGSHSGPGTLALFFLGEHR